MSAFDFLKPAPIIAEIQDESLVKQKYRYWRFRTLAAMYVGYAFYYLTAKYYKYSCKCSEM